MRGSQPWNTNRSRVLRANATSAEARLWRELRSGHLDGHKFVRQAPIGRYFVDFLCREAYLVIEVDGATHGEPAERARDAERTAHLESLGYRIFRATNDDVFHNISGVLAGILRALSGDRD
ncbi:MAG: DUF559 domain-containing protein, partial [Hyphomicrobiaceae bacterium]|nr:DUF559 domain-containing protein [Hyphomicrobiaceae bacterium]